ncbi:MAG: N-acetylmuramoyl-L-alanine amidase [Pseudomonadota bacterium]|nr:N-acetylmuramoyl-L-alanine amidase [Pseudomonadota bacterium]
MKRTLCGILMMLLAADAIAAAVIENIRVRKTPERTRVVLDASAPLEHKVFTLPATNQRPDRLVIDVPEARLSVDTTAVDVGDGPILGLRTSQKSQSVRIVLDLDAPVRPRSFVLSPILNLNLSDRLVVDLYSKEQQSPAQRVERLTNQMRDVIVAIDAGHGGDDPGAIGPDKLYEKVVVFEIAQKMAQMFDNAPGFRALMIREGDYYLALRERTAKARKGRADIFLSIHADAFKTADAHGASVYAISEKGATSETARWLAEKENRADLIGGAGEVTLDDKDDLLVGVLLDLSITASLSQSLEMGGKVLSAIEPINRLHKKQVEQASFAVLKSPDIPSLLVETGYISNPTEARRLATEQHQHRMAYAIFSGVRDYLSDNPPEGTWLAWKKSGTPVEALSYRIVSGDTLSGIADRHRISASRLREVNGLSGDLIRIGQVLKIPAS